MNIILFKIYLVERGIRLLCDLFKVKWLVNNRVKMKSLFDDFYNIC